MTSSPGVRWELRCHGKKLVSCQVSFLRARGPGHGTAAGRRRMLRLRPAKSASVGADGLLQVGQGLLRLHAVVRHLLHHGLDGAVDGAGGGGSIGKHGLIEITVTLLYTGRMYSWPSAT